MGSSNQNTSLTMYKLLHALFSTLILILLTNIAHCGEDTVTLRVYSLPEYSGRASSESTVLERFQEEHPNIRLRKATGIRIEGGDAAAMTALMQIAGDISPDVLFVRFRLVDTYVKKGFLMPLDKFMAKMPQSEIDRLVPAKIQDVCRRKGPDGRKHWYALPTYLVVRNLVYRKDMFVDAGLDPNKPPKTWEELEEYAKKLTDPSKNKYGLVISKGESLGWDFVNFVWSQGGDILKVNKDESIEPTFNRPEVVEALYYFVRLTRKKWKASDGKWYRGVAALNTDINVHQPGNNYAMGFSYLHNQISIVPPETTGVGPIPHPKGGHSSPEITAAMMGIYAGVKDPRVAQAAFDYISFQNSDEAQRIIAKTWVQNGYGKFLNPELLKRFGYTDILKEVGEEWKTIYRDAMKYGKPEPYWNNCIVVYRELSRPIEQAMYNKDVLAALDSGNEQGAKKRIKQILDQAQIETSERMFNILSPKVKRMRHNITLAFLLIASAGFVATTIIMMRSFRRSAPEPTPGHKKPLVAILLLAPAVLSVLVWQYYPLIKGTIIAFQDYNVMGRSTFSGIENFSTVLFDKSFWHSVYITLIYTILYMLFAFVSPIFLALLLAEIPRGKILFRTLFYLPAVLSGLVVTFLWKSFYKPAGLLNTLLNPILGLFGGRLSESWLDKPNLAIIAVLLPIIWAGMGPGSLIYLAALKTIPEEFYEASEVDGAGVIRKVWNITLPSIKMLVLINAIGALVGSFMSSEMILAMTAGGPYTPDGATEVVGLQLFYSAFVYLKFGVANAMAWVLGFMLIGFTMIQLKNLSRVEFKGGR